MQGHSGVLYGCCALTQADTGKHMLFTGAGDNDAKRWDLDSGAWLPTRQPVRCAKP